MVLQLFWKVSIHTLDCISFSIEQETYLLFVIDNMNIILKEHLTF